MSQLIPMLCTCIILMPIASPRRFPSRSPLLSPIGSRIRSAGTRRSCHCRCGQYVPCSCGGATDRVGEAGEVVMLTVQSSAVLEGSGNGLYQ
ncbi:hypothetical protein BC830DRAFT_1107057 [Chytriomyces sp. MP71]|nr:hypothetical protein BC830DRAFT_1107057 [Chytriomyces sp. MP71]